MKDRPKLKMTKLEPRELPNVELDQSPLTERQRQVLDQMVIRFRADYRPPSVRELMDDLGVLSPNGIMCHLKALTTKGHLLELPDCSSRRFVPISIKAQIDALIN